MKKYRSTLPGFKEYPNCFIIKKMKVNKDNYYFYRYHRILKFLKVYGINVFVFVVTDYSFHFDYCWNYSIRILEFHVF